jgi:hypothetical protein
MLQFARVGRVASQMLGASRGSASRPPLAASARLRLSSSAARSARNFWSVTSQNRFCSAVLWSVGRRRLVDRRGCSLDHLGDLLGLGHHDHV